MSIKDKAFNTPCPCSSGKSFTQCCQPFLNKESIPESAEQLMRSRYSAFVTENEGYLLNTWHHENKPNHINFDDKTKWLGLKVKRIKAGLSSDSQGWVEFVARYKIAGKAERIEELSYFIKDKDAWLYVAAEEREWDTLN